MSVKQRIQKFTSDQTPTVAQRGTTKKPRQRPKSSAFEMFEKQGLIIGMVSRPHYTVKSVMCMASIAFLVETCLYIPVFKFNVRNSFNHIEFQYGSTLCQVLELYIQCGLHVCMITVPLILFPKFI